MFAGGKEGNSSTHTQHHSTKERIWFAAQMMLRLASAAATVAATHWRKKTHPVLSPPHTNPCQVWFQYLSLPGAKNTFNSCSSAWATVMFQLSPLRWRCGQTQQTLRGRHWRESQWSRAELSWVEWRQTQRLHCWRVVMWCTLSSRGVCVHNGPLSLLLSDCVAASSAVPLSQAQSLCWQHQRRQSLSVEKGYCSLHLGRKKIEMI